MLPSQPNQALIDGLAVLQELAVSDGPTGSREMGRKLNLEPTRVNRLLRTLAHLGMASQTADRKYVPGPAMHVLSAQSLFGSGLIKTAIGPLQDLERLGLVVALGVLWRDQVCYLYHAAPGMSASVAVGRVGLFPASQSGIGHALLARMSSDDVRALYGDNLVPGYETVDALIARLDIDRERGWSHVAQADTDHTSSLGVAVGDPAFTAIALSGSIDEDNCSEYVAALTTAAKLIEAAHTGRKS
ncbi:MAG TPA: helix-turn-helix domain-containing protein [Capsulimonadaceae bacterium]|jgi:DNA-binding IclR family transcriptional regulator